MYGDMATPAETKTIKGLLYEYYNQYYEKEDCVAAAKEIRDDGHKAYTVKSKTHDNSYSLYVYWNEEANPFL